MQSKASSVEQYLKALDPDRRAAISAVRDVVNANIDRAFEEGMQYGMIGWYLPHSRYPAGYHCDPKQPLPFAGLASQKQHMSIYLMGLYVGPDGGPKGQTELSRWFQSAWERTGRKLDMGKACVRFKKLDDVALDVLAQAFRRLTAAKYVEGYEAALALSGKSPNGKSPRGKSPRGKSPSAKRAAKAPAKPGGSSATSVAKRPAQSSATPPKPVAKLRAQPAAKALAKPAPRRKAAAKR
ncbi:MAG: DUF1801 domain-containing protein [Planctomycetes bacterium]|nr:DUF1801 domain-containing protein [Planctomycetota bacterium]